MTRRLILLALLAACSAVGACSSQYRFFLSGTITASPRLKSRIEQPNAVLLIVASNEAGVPVAVTRIIDPRLPLRYQMRNEDLVLPGPVWQGPLMVRVFLGTEGEADPTAGKPVGEHSGHVHTGERNVNVVIDR